MGSRVALAEDGRALGEEGRDAFLGVVGAEDAVAGLQRLGDGLGIGPIEREVDDRLGRLQRQARPLRQHLRGLELCQYSRK